MMSLVAYAASSDEEDSDKESDTTEENSTDSNNVNISSGFTPKESVDSKTESDISITQSPSTDSPELIPTTSTQLKLNLPAPSISSSIETIVENDDEFLRKKAVPTQLPPPPKNNKMIPRKREKVKIIIPALSEFEDNTAKRNICTVAPQPQNGNKSCGLLNLLPKPKLELLSMGMKKISTTSMVPHSVTKKQSSDSIPSGSTLSTTSKPTIKSIPSKIPLANDSDDDDNDDEDFFSLNTAADLPEANLQKINELVANKMASISNAMKHKLVNENESENNDLSTNAEEIHEPIASKMDQKTMEALCGSSAKRSRKYEDVNIIDISDDQVLPNRDEWLRQQLTSKTEYQPKGLVDEEPGAGTRKKHQITYLAHQARANEQELQAMWAANRHARRLTQNKYGF